MASSSYSRHATLCGSIERLAFLLELLDLPDVWAIRLVLMNRINGVVARVEPPHHFLFALATPAKMSKIPSQRLLTCGGAKKLGLQSH